MSIMNGKEMMAVCEEKGLLVPHDDIPIIGLDGTVVNDGRLDPMHLRGYTGTAESTGSSHKDCTRS